MFQEAYKKAYDSKVPDKDFVQKIEDKVAEKAGGARIGWVLRPVVAVMAVFFLVSVTATPILAKEFPALYRLLDKYAPALAEYVLPEERSCSSAGIKMQVEAIHVEDKDAEVVISFTDEPGYDYIHGKIDLYDSYGITSYSGVSNVGGSSFLEYDTQADKAYYRMQMSSWDAFDKEKYSFAVRMILTNCAKEKQELDMSGMNKEPVLKTVTLNGTGGLADNALLQKYLGKSEEELWRSGAKVLDVGAYDSAWADQLTLTGIAYADGILRIQNCRGKLDAADRHMEIALADSEGNEQYCDYSVYWQEEIGGERMAFNEQWFLIGEEELEKLQVFAYRYVTDGCVKGDWEVVFEISE